ncbi:contractile injection system tape measure protein [Rubritalea marina]|uniref:contractile injection system tape measure protein n=1 Tax=Rubritalea marina TaxID=361055 RepID=UPI000364FA8A|nr:contractile injection system tape measure protein [Rubritalea marina]
MDEHHRIETMRFMLETPDGVDTHELQNTVSRSFKDRVQPRMSQLLSEASQGQHFTLDTLEVDLGSIDIDHLESELPERAVEAIRTQLRQAIQIESIPPSRAAPSQTLRTAIYLLENAATPWWAPNAQAHSLGDWLLEAINDSPLAMLEYLESSLQQASLRARFLQALSPKQRERFFKRARRQSSGKKYSELIETLERELEAPEGNALESLRSFLIRPPQNIYPSQLQTMITAAVKSHSKERIRQELRHHLRSASLRRALIDRLPKQGLEDLLRYLAPNQSQALILQTLAALELVEGSFQNHASHLRSARHSLWSLSILRVLETGDSHHHLSALLDAFPNHHRVDRKSLYHSVSRSLAQKQRSFAPDLVEQVQAWLERRPSEDKISSSVEDEESSVSEEVLEEQNEKTTLSPEQETLLKQLQQVLRRLQPLGRPIAEDIVQRALQTYQETGAEGIDADDALLSLYQDIANAGGITLVELLETFTAISPLPEPLRSIHQRIDDPAEPNEQASKPLLQHLAAASPRPELQKYLESVRAEDVKRALEDRITWSAFLDAPTSIQALILNKASPNKADFYQEYLPQLWSLKQGKNLNAPLPPSTLYATLMRGMLEQTKKLQSALSPWQEVLEATRTKLSVTHEDWRASFQPWLEQQLDPHVTAAAATTPTQTKRSSIELLKELIEQLEQGNRIDQKSLLKHGEQALRESPRALKEQVEQAWFQSRVWKDAILPQSLTLGLIKLVAPSQAIPQVYPRWKAILSAHGESPMLSEAEFLQSALQHLLELARDKGEAKMEQQILESLAEEVCDVQAELRKELVHSISSAEPEPTAAAESPSSAEAIEAIDPTQTPPSAEPFEVPSDTEAMIELWAQMLEKLWTDDPLRVIQHLSEASLSGTHAAQSLRSVSMSLVRDFIRTIYPQIATRTLAILEQFDALQEASHLPGIETQSELDAVVSETLLLALTAKRRSGHHSESLALLILESLADAEGESVSNYAGTILNSVIAKNTQALPEGELLDILRRLSGDVPNKQNSLTGSLPTDSSSSALITVLSLTDPVVPTPEERELNAAIHALSYSESQHARQQVITHADTFLERSRILSARLQMDLTGMLAPRLQTILQATVQRVADLAPRRSEQELGMLALQALIEKPMSELREVLLHYFKLLELEATPTLYQLFDTKVKRPKLGDTELDLWLFQELEAAEEKATALEWHDLDAARRAIQGLVENEPEALRSQASLDAIVRSHEMPAASISLIRDLQRVLVATRSEPESADFSPLTLSLLQESQQNLHSDVIEHVAQLQGGDRRDWITQHWQTIQELAPSFENPRSLRALHQAANRLLPDQAISLPNLAGSVPTHFEQIPAEPISMPNQPRESSETPAPVVTDVESEVWKIENAGLALFAPYIEMLVDRAGLLEHRNFPSTEHAIQAVFLLQHVITGEYKAHEPELLLNRIICNLPLEQPLPRSVEPDSSWPELVAGLKSAVIHHWSTIGETTHEGLIQTFVKRSGSLRYHHEDGWSLHVDSGPYDMLLTSLPWAISKIQFPWMHEAIRVEWI